MNLLFRVLYAAHCKSTHHKLVMDSLRFLAVPDVDLWRSVFLKHHAPFLSGAKAPDEKFKDFRNHVLHVGDNYWGGAIGAAELWYGRSLERLRLGDWVNGVYAAGILSHYYTDPLMPFHTAQSEAENNIHRATEWSVTKSYSNLWAILERDLGFPTIDVPGGNDWLAQMIRSGAETSHAYYEELIAHYDFAVGSKNPLKGLDEHAQLIIARLLGHAAVGFSKLLAKLIQEAAVTPPDMSTTVETAVASLTVPIQWVAKNLNDHRERKLIMAMYDEFKQTGRVETHLPEENRAIRSLIAEERKPQVSPNVGPQKSPVQQVAVEKEVVAKEVVTPAPKTIVASEPKYYLAGPSPIVDAPSIGPKMAERFIAVGITTISEFLQQDPEQLSASLKIAQLTPKLIELWQDQSRLCCTIPELRGHDSQILVASGYRTAKDVASADIAALADRAIAIASSPEGQRVLRGCSIPDLAEVTGWVTSAQTALSQDPITRAA